MFLELKNIDIGIWDAIVFSIVAIVIVFVILGLLVLLVKAFALIKFKDQEPVLTTQTASDNQSSVVNIEDEDMMVAALVATAEYVEETKNTNVQVKKIRKIN